ncbi:MAG: hypothetical protein QGI18_05830 [Candidatus Marinimicrobia bacterium]|jgi:hypothetical protein|nr:hypothetical protein [Candidatus Neomarinimicrobiota bacterium]
MAPSILGNANAILAIPNSSKISPGPATNYIIQENNVGPGTFRMLMENGVDLMIREN